MKALFTLIVLFAVSNSSLVYAQSEDDLIRQAVNKYIEGSTNGKPALLKEVFHPDLNLYYIRNNQFSVWSGTDYIADTKEGEPTGETGKIISIDYSGDAAVAKAEIIPSKGTSSYTDYFLLLKTNGAWSIIHKMFTRTSENRNDSELKSIEQSLTDYIEGTANGQPDRLRRAFHKDFRLYFVRDNEINSWSGEGYINNFKEGETHNRIGEIISIDYENNAAIAEVEIRMPDRKRIYTDYFLILKIQDDWKIVHKSFSFRTY